MIFRIGNLLSFFCLFSIASFAAPSIEDLTLEEKIGQLLMVHFHGETANEDAKTLIQDVHVGAIIYYEWANGLTSPEQVSALSRDLQKLTESNRMPIPLFIAADQEGGAVSRLNKGFTIFPGNKALGMTKDPALADSSAFAMGIEMRAVGVNMNLAPVVDINLNPRNPAIGLRSYGNSPELVLTFAENALRGYHRAGMITSLKHFPGHGDVEIDSHEDLPILEKSREELEQVEFLPFSLLASEADTIMVAHLLVPALDPTYPSSLSKKTLDILRNELHFQGIVIADSLVMEGILKSCASIEEASIQSLLAGCDILTLGGKQLIESHAYLELSVTDIQRIHSAILNAVKEGRLSEEKINESVAKILELKERYHFFTSTKNEDLEIEKVVRSKEHVLLAQKIAFQAIEINKNNPMLFSFLPQKQVSIVAPQALQKDLLLTSFLKIGKTSETIFFHGLASSDKETQVVMEGTKNAEIIVFFAYNAWKSSFQKVLLYSLLDTGKPVILLVTRDPIDAALFPKADLILTTFGSTLTSLQAVCDKLIYPFDPLSFP